VKPVIDRTRVVGQFEYSRPFRVGVKKASDPNVEMDHVWRGRVV
jgi:hypothetical protein